MKEKIRTLALFLMAPSLALAADTRDSLHEEFLEQRRILVEEQMVVYEAFSEETVEARDQALEQWREENRERIIAVQEIAVELGRRNEESETSAEAVEDRIAALRENGLPDSLPPAQRAFLERRRELMLEQLEYERDIAHLPVSERRAALHQWLEESEENFAELRELARNASKEQEAQLADEPFELPEIPDGVSEEMRRFLEARYALIAEVHALERAHNDPTARDAAVTEWHENNRERIEHVHRLAREAQ